MLFRQVYNLPRTILHQYCPTKQPQHASQLLRHLSQSTRIKTTSESNLPAHYSEPSYYKYFSTFLTENNLHKNVPSALIFPYRQAMEEFDELYEIVKQSKSLDVSVAQDEDFCALAREELELVINKLIGLQEDIVTQSVLDDHDVTECAVEVRAGVGGQEASLFANELFNVYLRLIAFNGWDTRTNLEEMEQIKIDENTSLYSATVEVIGPMCYKMLRHEAGVHRVQRIPKTERAGRIHTSTASVSVTPVRKNLVTIKDSDLKFDMKTSSGAGGQNVNRLFTCVRCTHIPTGHVVECQESRYQWENKKKAIDKMSALLNQLEYDRLEKETRTQKRLQIGIAARSDKIRTYNFPQNRITDHRLSGEGSNLHNIIGYMAGEECAKMNSIMERLESDRHAELVKQVRTAFEQAYFKNNKPDKKK